MREGCSRVGAWAAPRASSLGARSDAPMDDKRHLASPCVLSRIGRPESWSPPRLDRRNTAMRRVAMFLAFGISIVSAALWAQSYCRPLTIILSSSSIAPHGSGSERVLGQCVREELKSTSGELSIGRYQFSVHDIGLLLILRPAIYLRCRYCLVTGIAGGAAGLIGLLKRPTRRAKVGACVSCGYDLRATPEA
jgi:hypothetical protein